MSFPVKRPVWRPRIREILFSTECFLLDEFSSKTIYLTSRFKKNWIGENLWFYMDEFSSKTVSEISQKFANKG